MKPFFSIIIPVYNVAPYLRECLDSVLAQTFPNWDAICIDDGSTDGSGAMLDEYAARDPRFRVFHQPNAGVSAARNKGIDEARGEYVTFVDPDDKIDICWLSTAKDLVVKYSPDVVRLRAKFWDGAEKIDEDSHFIENIVLNSNEEIKEWAWKNLPYRGWSYVLFAKSNMLKKVRFPSNVKIREDTIFVLDLVSQTNVFVQGEFDGYYYRCHKNSAFNGERTIVDTAAVIIEISILTRKYQPNDKASISGCLFEALIEWMQRCNRSEWRTDGPLRQALMAAREAGLLEIKGKYRRWFLPLWYFKCTGSLKAFYLTQAVFELASRIKWRIKLSMGLCTIEA